MINSRTFFLAGIVIAAAIYRIIPHPFNFTPILAIALFSGAKFSSRSQALLIPLLSMLLADFYLGLHNTMIFVYLALVLIVLFGFSASQIINQQTSAINSVFIALFGAIFSVGVFFLISNFGVWLTTELYPKNLTGLIQCYLAAIPFMQNNLFGTLLFSGLFFGGFQLAENKYPFLKQIHP